MLREAGHICARPRAGNGTRTRDPNLGKVVLYQLSYSRALCRTALNDASASHHPNTGDSHTAALQQRGNGGEGNRTPDLVNAIHALSQLSYAPGDDRARCGTEADRLEPRSIAVGIPGVNEIGLAKTSAASILQRLLGSPPTQMAPQIHEICGC
jgi:hypothetical protein